MSNLYHGDHRALQEQFDTVRLANSERQKRLRCNGTATRDVLPANDPARRN